MKRLKKVKKCPKCKGEGYVEKVMELHGMPHIMVVLCDKCDGTGELRQEAT